MRHLALGLGCVLALSQAACGPPDLETGRYTLSARLSPDEGAEPDYELALEADGWFHVSEGDECDGVLTPAEHEAVTDALNRADVLDRDGDEYWQGDSYEGCTFPATWYYVIEATAGEAAGWGSSFSYEECSSVRAIEDLGALVYELPGTWCQR